MDQRKRRAPDDDDDDDMHVDKRSRVMLPPKQDAWLDRVWGCKGDRLIYKEKLRIACPHNLHSRPCKLAA